MKKTTVLLFRPLASGMYLSVYVWLDSLVQPDRLFVVQHIWCLFKFLIFRTFNKVLMETEHFKVFINMV